MIVDARFMGMLYMYTYVNVDNYIHESCYDIIGSRVKHW